MKKTAVTLALIVLLPAAAIALGRRTSPAPSSGPGPAPVETLRVAGLSDPEIMVGLQKLTAIEPPMEKSAEAGAVEGWCITVPEGHHHNKINQADKSVDGKKVPNGTATFSFDVETAGNYVFWAHKWWCCSCGRSFRYSIDGEPWRDFITDSNYRVWEWATPRAERQALASGRHTLMIANRQDGMRLDCFLFTTGGHTPAALRKN